MNHATRTTIQEVLFDLYDAKDSRMLALAAEAELPQEFDTLNEWLDEQIAKLERIGQPTEELDMAPRDHNDAMSLEEINPHLAEAMNR